MRTIAIINQKGGCGKTTTAINLSAVLARNGKRVLLVDMDPQGHCAAGLGIPEQRLEVDIGDAMLAVGQRPIDPAKLLWRAVRNLDLAPSRMKLAGLEAAKGGLAELPDRDRRLAQVLEKFSHEYDVAVVDCPPSIGLLTYNALSAADMVIVPVETGFFALQGALRQVNTVKTLGKRLGANIPVWLIATMHDAKNTVATDLHEELVRRFRDKLIPVTIRHDARLREATSFGQTVIDYAPGSMGAEDYGRLGVWVGDNLRIRTSAPVEHGVGVIGGEVVVGEALTTARPGMTGPVAGPNSSPVGGSITGAAANPPLVQTTLNTSLGVGGIASAPVGVGAGGEIKMSRAEDVARKAQEFLRRIALGKAAAGGASGSSSGAAGNGAGVAIAPAPRHGGADQSATAMGGSGPGGSGPGGVGLGGSGDAAAVGSSINDEVLNADSHKTITLHPPRNVVQLQDAPKPSPPTPDAQQLLGVRETRQGMLFIQPLSVGRQVAIAGSFNDWSASASIMRRNDASGVYELCLRLQPGKFAYRLVVDGKWLPDPHNPNTEPNPFGEMNSIGYVAGK